MKKLYKFLLCFFMGILVFGVFPFSVKAEAISFSTRPILPKNQRKATKDYYDLIIEPNKEQKVKYQIINRKDQPIRIKLEILKGATSANGTLVYNKEETKSEYLSLPDIVSCEEEVEVPAMSTVTTDLLITPPKQRFEGMVLGAIRSSEIVEESTEKGSIINEVGDVTAISIREKEELPTPEISFKQIKKDNENQPTELLLVFENISPRIVEELDYTFQLYKKGQGKAIEELTVKNYRIAPQSRFEFPWLLTKELAEGNYRVKVKIHSKEHKKSWKFTQKIGVGVPEEKNTYKMVWVSIGVLSLLFIGILLMRRVVT